MMRKRQAFQILCVIALATLIWSGYSAVLASSDHEPTIHQIVYVKPGDSVWTIAAKYATPKDDVRNLVSAIIKTNSLSNSVQIYPGQALKIPVTAK